MTIVLGEVYLRDLPGESPEDRQLRRALAASVSIRSVSEALTTLRGHLQSARTYRPSIAGSQPRSNN